MAVDLSALAKWPDVPACYDWLSLDRRGDWRLQGERITHGGLIAFINRQYNCDESGCWFVQNGPQRVYLQLELAPLVLGVRRLNVGEAGAGTAAGFEVQAHTDQDVGAVQSCWLDEHGRLYLLTEAGLGVVRSMDMDAAADALASGLWGEPQEVAFADMPARFGFMREPQPVRA